MAARETQISVLRWDTRLSLTGAPPDWTGDIYLLSAEGDHSDPATRPLYDQGTSAEKQLQ